MSGCSEANVKAMKEKRGNLAKKVKSTRNYLIDNTKMRDSFVNRKDYMLNHIKDSEKSIKQFKNGIEFRKRHKLLNRGMKKIINDEIKKEKQEINNAKKSIVLCDKTIKDLDKTMKKDKESLSKQLTQTNKLDRKIISCKNKKSTRKRCPNGTRKNKKTGNCEKK